MDPQPLPGSRADTIGEETLSGVNWLSAMPELLPWVIVGVLCGGGVALFCLGASLASGEQMPKWLGALLVAVGSVLVTSSGVLIYVARQWYRAREERKRLSIRAEVHDEMIGKLESIRTECDERLRSEMAIITQQDRGSRMLREDAEEMRNRMRALIRKSGCPACRRQSQRAAGCRKWKRLAMRVPQEVEWGAGSWCGGERRRGD